MEVQSRDGEGGDTSYMCCGLWPGGLAELACGSLDVQTLTLGQACTGRGGPVPAPGQLE